MIMIYIKGNITDTHTALLGGWPLEKMTVWNFFLRLRYTSEPNLWMPWALTAVIEELDFKTRDILAREGKKVITFYAFCHKDFISQIIASQYYFNLWHLGLIEKNIWSQLFKLGFISEGQVNNPVLLSYRTLDKDI